MLVCSFYSPRIYTLQPAQKWLKDRKDRKLAFDDILHYQKIIVALTETDRLMKEINKIAIEWEDAKERLKKHNNGEVNSTKPYKPWKPVLSIEKPTRSEAMALEKKIKNLNRERLIAFIQKYQ